MLSKYCSWAASPLFVLMKVWSLTLYHKREVNSLFRLILSKIQGFEDVFNNKKQVVFDTTLRMKGVIFYEKDKSCMEGSRNLTLQ